MRKLTYLKIIAIIGLISVILFISSTYSWIIESPYQTPMNLLYLKYEKEPQDTNSNRNVVYSPDISIQTLKYISGSTPIPVTSVEAFTSTNQIPGSSQRFILRLENDGNEAADVHLAVCGVSCTYKENGETVASSGLLKYVYFEIKAGSGYDDANVDLPDYQFISLYDLFQTSVDGYAAIIYTDLIVPTTSGNIDYVDLDCRIWLDTSMPYYENLSIRIDHFAVSM